MEAAPRLSLAGRHALVCGASAGIGRAAALALASLGAWVTALARREAALSRVVEEARQAGAPAADLLVADMDDVAGLRAAVEGWLAEHGPVHVLVNNSGGPPPGAILDATEEDLLVAFRRLVLSAHVLVRLVLPGMRQAGYGRIVNVISTGLREPIPGLGVSNTVRGALASWAKTLSRELPPGVTVNNVLPGYTDTERLRSLAESRARRQGVAPDSLVQQWVRDIPEGRLARPDELGAVIAFLASPAASYVRGVSLPVDGGWLQSV